MSWEPEIEELQRRIELAMRTALERHLPKNRLVDGTGGGSDCVRLACENEAARLDPKSRGMRA